MQFTINIYKLIWFKRKKYTYANIYVMKVSVDILKNSFYENEMASKKPLFGLSPFPFIYIFNVLFTHTSRCEWIIYSNIENSFLFWIQHASIDNFKAVFCHCNLICRTREPPTPSHLPDTMGNCVGKFCVMASFL